MAKLRALWTLHTTGGLDPRTAVESLRSSDEEVRAWTIQLAFESAENFDRLSRGANGQGFNVDGDLFAMPPSDLFRARVRMTVVGGEVVYGK